VIILERLDKVGGLPLNLAHLNKKTTCVRQYAHPEVEWTGNRMGGMEWALEWVLVEMV